MSTPVVFSMPSSPGEALTSITSGPRLARRISTPATSSPSVCAALIAISRSSGVILATVATPPRCRLERKSPSFAWRSMAATTSLPTTRQRISRPFASSIYSCTRIWALRPRKASITLSAACRVSASTTPIPWVPSTSFTTSGAPPTMAIKSLVSSGEWAMPVTGRSMPWRASSCNERSLSRARVIATDSLRG